VLVVFELCDVVYCARKRQHLSLFWHNNESIMPPFFLSFNSCFQLNLTTSAVLSLFVHCGGESLGIEF